MWKAKEISGMKDVYQEGHEDQTHDTLFGPNTRVFPKLFLFDGPPARPCDLVGVGRHLEDEHP